MLDKVIVYLDSQDFSKFTDSENGRGSPEVTSVLNRLLQEVDAGRVIVPISMPHISELIQYEGGGRDLAFQKAATIERISKKWACRYVTDMLEAELIDFAASKNILRSPPQSSTRFPLDPDGKWHPTIGPTVGGFRGQLEDAIEEELKTSVATNRQMRRHAKAYSRSRRFKDMLDKPEIIAQANKILSDYPLTEKFTRENYLIRHLKGEISNEVVETELLRAIRTPRLFVTWYFERYVRNKRYSKLDAQSRHKDSWLGNTPAF